jgi:Sec34-like family
VELQGTIGTTLEYFQELEHATRLLNHPGESLVLQTDFLYMVERVDICIEFLKAHVRPDPVCASLLILPPIGDSEVTKKRKSISYASSNV